MQLEHTLGARLLDRTTRRVAPTEVGLAYYERCLAIVAQVEETEAQIPRLHDEPKGVLKINATLSFGTRYLGQAIAVFMTRYGDLKVELRLSDRFAYPLEQGVDVLIRIGALADSNLIARRLGSTSMAILATPGYLKKHGEPTATMEITGHRILSYGQSTSLQKWMLQENGKPTSRTLNVHNASNNGDVLCDAAIAGVGIARLPTFIACDAIADGQLKVIIQNATPPDLNVHALCLPN